MEQEFIEFSECDKSLKHKLGSVFKDPVSHMCLAGPVVASWSLTHEVAGLSSFTVITNILSPHSGNSVKMSQGLLGLCSSM